MSSYIRKIDELGRIVIPKEVRNKLKIKENENIIINLDKDKIKISKYSYLYNYQNYINEICNQITEIYKVGIIVKDLEKELYNNLRGEKKYHFEDNIINDSIVIGKIIIESDTNENIPQLLKLVCRIIPTYLQNI